MSKAIVIHPDKVQRVSIRHTLESVPSLDFHEFDNDTAAAEWLANATDPVDFVFSPWEMSEEKKTNLNTLRRSKACQSALFFLMNCRKDLEWLATLFHSQGIVEAITAKPTRTSTLIRTVQHLLTVDLMTKPCALVVDDEPEICDVVAGYLKEFGFSKVIQASGGEKALELMDKHAREISVVLSDWNMPRMSGLVLLKILRSRADTRRIPFVMVTAKTPTEQIKTIQAAELGVNGYLLKPFNLKSFHSQLEAVLIETGRARKAEAYLIAGKALTAQGSSKAEDILNEGLKLLPEEPALWEALGDDHCFKWKDMRGAVQAVEAYEQALKLSPLNTPLVMKCFEVYSVLGRLNDAVRILRGQFNRNEHDDGFYTRLGKIYLQSGELEAASHELRKAIAANPSNTEAQSLFQTSLALEEERSFKKAS